MPTNEPSPILRALPVFFDPHMVARFDSFSPSAAKPEEVVRSWQASGTPLAIKSPVPVTERQIFRAHDPGYVQGIINCSIRNGFGNCEPAVAKSLPWTSGAMLSAARAARANGRVAIAPCSGFHHAGYDTGGGYCTFNGLMVAALALLNEDNCLRIGILDCDQHYGDGTEDIIKTLRTGASVRHYTAGGKWYRAAQAHAFLSQLPGIVESFHDCDVLLYQAGADPHVDDPLGGWLTTAQLSERDAIVFATAQAIKLPVAWNLAGGYQSPLRKVLDIHDNTLHACAEVYLAPWRHN